MMNRLYTLLVFIALAVSVSAQQAYKAYCEVVVWSGKGVVMNALVTFDFGMKTHPTASLYDSNGQPLTFVSGMDAVNYLAQRGWTLVSTYYNTYNQLESTHFVMEKTVTSESQVTKGLLLKPTSRSADKPRSKK